MLKRISRTKIYVRLTSKGIKHFHFPSATAFIILGIPQGSTLGPLKFSSFFLHGFTGFTVILVKYQIAYKSLWRLFNRNLKMTQMATKKALLYCVVYTQSFTGPLVPNFSTCAKNLAAVMFKTTHPYSLSTSVSCSISNWFYCSCFTGTHHMIWPHSTSALEPFRSRIWPLLFPGKDFLNIQIHPILV